MSGRPSTAAAARRSRASSSRSTRRSTSCRATTDDQLVNALRDGADRLRRVAVDECDPDAGTETTTTETTPTETDDRPRTLTETEPTETLPTETTQTPTTTTPDAAAAHRPTPTPPAPEPAAREPDPARAPARHARRRRDPGDPARLGGPMSTDVIAGRYELGERLGYGGMSTVQVAVDRRLERQVAVKLLAEHLADDSQFISRFRREALSAARLVHPNIVQVFDFGLDEVSGRHYIVMEYIQGRSGAEILREETRLGVADTLELVDGACRGLVHAHRMGVIHRDVKPGNILRSDDGAVKLADFGIAKAVGGTSQLTQAGSVLGTAAYLAPEQASGTEVGPAADMYGLGVVTYQLLAGRLPYEAGSLTELALLQQREYPIRLDEISPEVPAALALAVEKALALEPARALRQRRGDAPRAARRRARDRPAGVGVRPPRRRCSAPRRADRGDAHGVRPAARRRAAGPGAWSPSRRPAGCRRRATSRSPTSRPRGATRAAAPQQRRPGQADRGARGRRGPRRGDRLRDRQLAGQLRREPLADRRQRHRRGRRSAQLADRGQHAVGGRRRGRGFRGARPVDRHTVGA